MDPDFARQYYESATSNHWWFQGRRELVSLLLRDFKVSEGAFVDLGAGAESLFPSALKVVKLDVVRPDSVSGMFVQASATHLPFPSGAFDGLGLFDVLEHLRHPKECLSEVLRVVRPGGLVLVTVPAYRLLWSPHDDLVGHVHRYTLGEIRELLETAGLRVEWSSAFFGFLVLPGTVRALLSLESPMSMPSRPINRVLRNLAIRSVRRRLQRPSRLGLSLGVVASVGSTEAG